ncbi:MAG: acyl-CoA dehydrogenase family protein [Breznakibacter sp.]
MSPFLNNEHDAWREYVRQFAEAQIRPVAAQLDETETFSDELTRKMGQAGLFGIDVPRKLGGGGKDTLSYIIAVEELARIDGSQAATMAAHNSLGIAPIVTYGTDEQKEKLLPILCSGEALWAFCLTEENAGCDARGVETTVQHDNGHWVVNGTKRYITNGSNNLLQGYTLLAITGHHEGEKEYSTVLVDRNAPGVNPRRMQGKMMWRASDTAQISFDQVKIPQSALLGERGKGLRQMLKTLDGGRLSIAAMGLGLAQGAFEQAKAYAAQRKQFGQTIDKFQVIAFKLADMALKIELARNTLYKACWLKDQGALFGKEAAMSKLYCSQIAKEVSDEAIQIAGGAGLFKHNELERFYRDQRILQIGEGTSEILQMVIARHIGAGN